MHIIEHIGEFLAPTRCASCDRYGPLFCPACIALIQTYAPARACSKCAAPYGELTCTECAERIYAFSAAVVLGPFKDGLARSIVLFKDSNERRLGRYLGILLGARIRSQFGEWGDLITWLPPHPASFRRRGFDHGEYLARGVAASTGIAPKPLLSRHSFVDMRTLNREERLKAVRFAFQAIAPLEGEQILLVDDVITTGASADAAARILLEAGAGEVRVAALARTW